MQINDCIVEALGGGHINDLLLEYYHDYGATSNNLTDAEYEFLVFNGATPGHINDMWFEALISLGYSGTLDDMFHTFWCEDGGIIGERPPRFDGIINDRDIEVDVPILGFDASTHFQTGGDVDTYSLDGEPDGLVIDPITGIVTGTPTILGEYITTVTGTNEVGSATSNDVTINVFEVVDPPLFTGTIADIRAYPGEPMDPVDVSGNFATGGAPENYTLTGNPSWMSITDDGIISGTPDIEAVHNVTVTAHNVSGSADSNEFTVNVVDVIDTRDIDDIFGDGSIVETYRFNSTHFSLSGNNNPPSGPVGYTAMKFDNGGIFLNGDSANAVNLPILSTTVEAISVTFRINSFDVAYADVYGTPITADWQTSLRIATTSMAFALQSQSLSRNITPVVGELHHVVISRNSPTNISSFFDKVRTNHAATATSNDPHAITIGVFRGTTAGCDLDIQQVRLFNRPLTDAEVAILYDEEM